MSLTMVACWLGAYLLSPCDLTSAEVARAYSPHPYTIPAAHLATVRCLYWTPDGRGESQQATGCIGLQRQPNLHMLAHEVGHQVSYRGARLFRFDARFWPGGVQLGMPPSGHARINAREDFAEVYAFTLLKARGLSVERREWMLRELPELGQH